MTLTIPSYYLNEFGDTVFVARINVLPGSVFELGAVSSATITAEGKPVTTEPPDKEEDETDKEGDEEDRGSEEDETDKKEEVTDRGSGKNQEVDKEDGMFPTLRLRRSCCLSSIVIIHKIMLEIVMS